MLTCHCTVGVGNPLADAVNETLAPSHAVWSVGFSCHRGRFTDADRCSHGGVIHGGIRTSVSAYGTSRERRIRLSILVMVGSAPEIVPSTALLKVTVRPLRATRSAAAIALARLLV